LNYQQVSAADLLATEPRDVIASPNDVRVLLADNITPFQQGINATYAYHMARF